MCLLPPQYSVCNILFPAEQEYCACSNSTLGLALFLCAPLCLFLLLGFMGLGFPCVAFLCGVYGPRPWVRLLLVVTLGHQDSHIVVFWEFTQLEPCLIAGFVLHPRTVDLLF